MSFKLTLIFDNYEELFEYINDMEKCKRKQEKKKLNQQNEIIEENIIDILKSDIIDKRGLHQQKYHNEAKIYQSEHPELSYREALNFVYKNNKNI